MQTLEQNKKSVTEFRIKLKINAVAYKGGKCEKCGYNKNYTALDFHHINPSKKDFNIASGSIKSWEKVKQELDKCQLLCANCHREVHQPNNILTDELISNSLFKEKNNEPYNCKSCNEKLKFKNKNQLCFSCFHKTRKKINWPSKEELLKELETKSFSQLGRELNVSDNAIRKRLRNMADSLGIEPRSCG